MKLTIYNDYIFNSITKELIRDYHENLSLIEIKSIPVPYLIGIYLNDHALYIYFSLTNIHPMLMSYDHIME